MPHGEVAFWLSIFIIALVGLTITVVLVHHEWRRIHPKDKDTEHGRHHHRRR